MWEHMNPEWATFVLGLALAVISGVMAFAFVKYKTERVAEDGLRIDEKLNVSVHTINQSIVSLNEIITLIKIANAEQNVVNKQLITTMDVLVNKLEKLDERVKVVETALMVIKSENMMLQNMLAKAAHGALPPVPVG